MQDDKQSSAPQETSGNLVNLSRGEEHEVRKRVSLRAAVVFETVRREGETELQRPALALAFSGLAAGMSMGFSLVASGVLQAALPDAPWRPLIVNFGYTIGFLIVILGSQQLFTENTLTALLPVLDDENPRSKLLQMLRLWGIVLVCNVIGAAVIATVLAKTGAFDPQVKSAFLHIGMTALRPSVADMLWRSILAGWLIALVVWLQPSADAQRLWVIVLITWLVGAANLSHVIAGSVEALYAVASGAYAWNAYVVHFLLPVLFGNCIGGCGLVALLNYGQIVPESGKA
ncbi:MAG: formate/nitrite transporter family protein [Candidatus Baltobacteraceae bacterium]